MREERHIPVSEDVSGEALSSALSRGGRQIVGMSHHSDAFILRLTLPHSDSVSVLPHSDSLMPRITHAYTL